MPAFPEKSSVVEKSCRDFSTLDLFPTFPVSFFRSRNYFPKILSAFSVKSSIAGFCCQENRAKIDVSEWNGLSCVGFLVGSKFSGRDARFSICGRLCSQAVFSLTLVLSRWERRTVWPLVCQIAGLRMIEFLYDVRIRVDGLQ